MELVGLSNKVLVGRRKIKVCESTCGSNWKFAICVRKNSIDFEQTPDLIFVD